MERTPDQAELWEVVAVRFATRSAAKSKVYLNFPIYHEADGDIGMDYYFWVLSNGRETVLVDTGFNEVSGGKHDRPQLITPREALARLGVDGASIAHVILTHLHYDHVGNLDLAPNAVFSLSRKELDFWLGRYAERALFASAVEREDVDGVLALQADGRLDLIEGDAEILPGIRVIEVGGHTPGQLVVVVATERGPVVLSSDAIHYYEELELQRPFLHLSNLVEVYECFDTVDELLGDDGILVPGHDPVVMERFEPVPGIPEGLAVSITAAPGA